MASNLLKCTTCNIVICELLAFIQNKVDVMDEESIVRLCTTAFSTEDIEAAKKLLFGSIPMILRNIKRKKNDKSEKNLYDVIAVFKQTDPEHVPIFVAKELSKLPPVCFDHIDATRTLKDIILMQNEIRELKNTYVTKEQLSEIKTEIDKLKHTTSNTCLSAINVNNNKRGGGGILDSFCLDSGPMGLTHIIEKSTPRMRCDDTNLARIVNESTVESCTSDKRREGPFSPKTPVTVSLQRAVNASTEIATTNVMSASEMERQCIPVAVAAPAQVNSGRPKRNTVAEIVNTDDEWKKVVPSEEWVQVQRKRLRNRLMGSKGKAINTPEVKFRAADISVPLFINNVDKETSDNDIVEYIQQKTKITVTIKKIDMKKQKRYNAYKIFVPHTKLSMFLDDDLWPEGIQFRKFIYFNRNFYDKNNDMNLIKNNNGCTP